MAKLNHEKMHAEIERRAKALEANRKRLSEMSLLERANMAHEFMTTASEILETALKFKAVMLKRGLKIAKTKCPRCAKRAKDEPIGETLEGRIAGSRNHFRMRCINGCGMAMME